MFRADIITEWAEKQNVALTGEQLALMGCFQARLLEVNAHMNLTAITDAADIAVKHFIDSLSVLPWLKPNAKVIDIGSGAGFPGIPLKIARPDIELTLLDSLRKRVLFLAETADMLGLGGVSCVHARAEAYKGGEYDICAARAVAKLNILAEYAMPLLKRGGLLLAMKGPDAAAEVKAAERAFKKAGGRIAEVRTVFISEGMGRTVVAAEKV